MDKKIIGLFVFILLVSGVFLVSSFGESDKVSDAVYDALEKGGEVRVIVKLKEVEEKKGFFVKTAKSQEEIKAGEKEVKEEVIEDIGTENIKHVFDKTISASISKEELDNLKENNEIMEIKLVEIMHTFLQDSVPLINASVVWPVNLSSQNITGISETICIIDTGINYSHQDFGGCTSAEFTSGTCERVIGGWDYCADDSTCITSDNDPIAVDGHGTHVAGIVAANGSINGVAINSKIVMMKAGNASGSFFTDDIAASIDWCVNNASIYNISVISMSLGGGQFNDYCDGVSSDITNSINNAVANNITVTISTGNTDPTYTNPLLGIANPACIINATRVTATNKSDAYASYAFRNSNFTDILAAPGSSINSTKVDGTYLIQSGTSMAAPHAAGAFALFRQFFRLQNGRVPTPAEIKTIFNSTGKQINDTGGTGLNFSRIDVFAAIQSIDTSNPVVSLLSPVNNTVQFTQNITFNCSANDVQLDNITLYVYNSSGDIYNNPEINDIDGTNGYLEVNVTNMSYGDYTWNCLAYDEASNFSFATNNFTLTIGQMITTLNSPANNNFVKINQTYNCSAETGPTRLLTNITFYSWNSTNDLVYNATENVNGTTNSSLFYFNFTNEEEYSWNCLSYDNESESDLGDANFTITYDVTNPEINSTISASVTSSTATITWTTNESVNSTINYSTTVNLGSESINTSFSTSHSFSLSSLSASTTYYYNLTNCDRANNCVVNGTNSFKTSTPVVVTNNGGSSGGGGGTPTILTATYVLNYSQASSGYTNSLAKNDKIKFTVFDGDNVEHSMTLDYVGTDSIEITINSEPIKLSLGVGQSIKLNLTNTDYYDLYIKLNSILNNKADITIQTINELIPKQIPLSVNETQELDDGEKEGMKKDIEFLRFKLTRLQGIIYGAGIIFIIVIIIIYVRGREYIKNLLKRKKRKKKK